MSNDNRPPESSNDSHSEIHDHQSEHFRRFGLSRRDFIGSTAAGAAAGAFASLGLDKAQAEAPGGHPLGKPKREFCSRVASC